jgi:predicted metal-dependent peptidase
MNIYELISKSSKHITYTEPFYGLVLLSLNKVVDERVQTACVSKHGINFQLSINPTFYAGLDLATQRGVLKHELLHIAFMHLLVWDKYSNKYIANIAADLEVNQYIQPEYKGPSWEFWELSSLPELNLPVKAGIKVYYDILSKNAKKGISPKLDAALDRMEQGEEKMHELWKEFSKLSDVEKAMIRTQIQSQIKKAAEQVKKSQGHIPGEMEHLITALFEVREPVIDWKPYFRQFIGMSPLVYTRTTRRRESRRIPGYPALKIKHRLHIAVARDTSGSVTDWDLREFDNEILHMYKQGTKITIIDCDAGVSDVWEFTGTIRDKVKGRGGTSFDPVIEFFNDNHRQFDALIYLTDGHCTAPKVNPLKRMLWIISSKGTTSYAEDYPYTYVQIKR